MPVLTNPSYQQTGYFSNLIIDYLNQHSDLKKLYNRYPTIDNFAAQIDEKQSNFDDSVREILVEELQDQYKLLETSVSTQHNINSLKEPNTFTVTTGHQLSLFTGPLYFLYKICSTINLSKALKQHHPNYNFVPVFWMASEDHDFEEVNFFNFNGKKISWNQSGGGAVGRIPTQGLSAIQEILKSELGKGIHAKIILDLFEKAYLEHPNLAHATRYLVNELFGDDGLVILDADTISLKKVFAPYIKKELMERNSFHKVNETSKALQNYSLQVNPREINLFYIKENIRERILFEKNQYKINNTSIQFNQDEIMEELEKHPNRFSPNVILRPLYQEVILPNLCYIGGAGELAYWFQLQSNFQDNGVVFPMLMLRNSALLVTKKQLNKIEKLNLTSELLFLKKENLITALTKKLSDFPINLESQKLLLKQQFEYLYNVAQKTDKSFLGAVKAQEAKQISGLENLEKRLLKAQKRKFHEELDRVTALQNELFPNGSLQERTVNFSEFYEEYGKDLISKLLENLQPFNQNFQIIEL